MLVGTILHWLSITLAVASVLLVLLVLVILLLAKAKISHGLRSRNNQVITPGWFASNCNILYM